MRFLDDDEKGVHTVRTLGGNQELMVVNEPGLYHLTFKSRKPEANAFRRWVFHEVLPSIRKTGSYSVKKGAHIVSTLGEELIQTAPRKGVGIFYTLGNQEMTMIMNSNQVHTEY